MTSVYILRVIDTNGFLHCQGMFLCLPIHQLIFQPCYTRYIDFFPAGNVTQMQVSHIEFSSIWVSSQGKMRWVFYRSEPESKYMHVWSSDNMHFAAWRTQMHGPENSRLEAFLPKV